MLTPEQIQALIGAFVGGLVILIGTLFWAVQAIFKTRVRLSELKVAAAETQEKSRQNDEENARLVRAIAETSQKKLDELTLKFDKYREEMTTSTVDLKASLKAAEILAERDARIRDDMRRDLSTMSNDKVEILQSVSEMKSQLKVAQGEVSELARERTQKQSELEATQLDRDAARTALEKANTMLAEQGTKVAIHEETIKDLQLQLGKLRDKIGEMERMWEQRDREQRELIDQLKRDNNALIVRAETAERERDAAVASLREMEQNRHQAANDTTAADLAAYVAEKKAQGQ